MQSSMRESGSYASSSMQFSSERRRRSARRRRVNSSLGCCDCGKAAIVLTSWTQENPGRRFWRCPNYQTPNDCKYFDWVDGEMNDRAKFVIFSLRNQCVELRNENRELRNNRLMGVGGGIEIGEMIELNDLRTEIQCQHAEIEWMALKLQTAGSEGKKLVKALKFYRIAFFICIVIGMVAICRN